MVPGKKKRANGMQLIEIADDRSDSKMRRKRTRKKTTPLPKRGSEIYWLENLKGGKGEGPPKEGRGGGKI